MARIDLNKLEELTASLTPVRDMALLLGVPESELREELADPLTRASSVYRYTKAAVTLKVRQMDLKLAEAGSPLAIAAVSGYIKDMRNDE